MRPDSLVAVLRAGISRKEGEIRWDSNFIRTISRICRCWPAMSAGRESSTSGMTRRRDLPDATARRRMSSFIMQAMWLQARSLWPWSISSVFSSYRVDRATSARMASTTMWTCNIRWEGGSKHEHDDHQSNRHHRYFLGKSSDRRAERWNSRGGDRRDGGVG